MESYAASEQYLNTSTVIASFKPAANYLANVRGRLWRTWYVLNFAMESYAASEQYLNTSTVIASFKPVGLPRIRRSILQYSTWTISSWTPGRLSPTKMYNLRSKSSERAKTRSPLGEPFDAHHTLSTSQLETDKFTGTAREFWKFVKIFKTNAAGRLADDTRRLIYVIHCCTGEAKAVIEDCVLLPESGGFEKAKDILHKEFGRPHAIAQSFIHGILVGGPSAAGDTDTLRKLVYEIHSCEINLTQTGYSADLNCSTNLKRIVLRLPRHLQRDRAKVADNILYEQKEPSFRQLNQFLERNLSAETNEYGLLASGAYRVSRRDVDDINQRSKLPRPHVNAAASKASSCPLCTAHHSLCDCVAFQARSTEEKLQALRERPELLKLDEQQWPKTDIEQFHHKPADLELKRAVTVLVTATTDLPTDVLFSYYSSWVRLRRAVAWFTRFKSYLHSKIVGKGIELKNTLRLDELNEAESSTLRCYTTTVLDLRCYHNCQTNHQRMHGMQIKTNGRFLDTCNVKRCQVNDAHEKIPSQKLQKDNDSAFLWISSMKTRLRTTGNSRCTCAANEVAGIRKHHGATHPGDHPCGAYPNTTRSFHPSCMPSDLQGGKPFSIHDCSLCINIVLGPPGDFPAGGKAGPVKQLSVFRQANLKWPLVKAGRGGGK
ncbi:protein disulfide-isomerase [Clonorchis sinensis]|uniref:Protein disulfide-isomerase n=1 Tax=Clonorchis sinensis TaxID=79923 RepID=G7YKD5_CLOSI|nr:protein disulfide-isomerase [Clonorchis sinensis]